MARAFGYDDGIYPAAQHQDINVPVFILGKAVDVIRLLEQRSMRCDFFCIVVVTQAPDFGGDVIATNFALAQPVRDILVQIP